MTWWDYSDSFFSEPSRGGTGFSNQQAGCQLIGVYRAPRAELDAWLGVRKTLVGGLLVVVILFFQFLQQY